MSNWQKLLGVNHADNIKNKEKYNRAALARSKLDSSSAVTHVVGLANQYPMFEGISGNDVNPVPSNGSSPSTDITDASHNDTIVTTSLEPPQCI